MGRALVADEVPCDPAGIASRPHPIFSDTASRFLCEIVCVSGTMKDLDVPVLNNSGIIPVLDVPVYIYCCPLVAEHILSECPVAFSKNYIICSRY